MCVYAVVHHLYLHCVYSRLAAYASYYYTIIIAYIQSLVAHCIHIYTILRNSVLIRIPDDPKFPSRTHQLPDVFLWPGQSLCIFVDGPAHICTAYQQVSHVRWFGVVVVLGWYKPPLSWYSPRIHIPTVAEFTHSHTTNARVFAFLNVQYISLVSRTRIITKLNTSALSAVLFTKVIIYYFILYPQYTHTHPHTIRLGFARDFAVYTSSKRWYCP